MYSLFSQYGERYLTHKDFLDLCSKLEIKLLSRDIDEKWLTFLEKEKILFPDFRIVKPIWYIDYLLKNNDDQQEKIKSKKWKLANLFFESIQRWSSSYYLFHPFDHKSLNSPYLERPKELKFHKWKNYLERLTDDNRKYSIERDIQYYPYWRAYHVYEINKACSNKYIINAFDDKLLSLYRRNHRIPLKKILNFSFPFIEPDILRKRIFEKDEDFNYLSFYIQSVNRAENISLHLYRQKLRNKAYDWEEDDRRIRLRKKRIAKITLSKFGVTIDKSIAFLKNLCEKYFSYEGNSVNNLAYMMRYDIYYLTKLISDGFELTNAEIENKIVRIRLSHHKNPLKYILQGEFAEAREEAYRIFKEYIARAFKINIIEVDQTEFEEFLKFLDETGMSIIYLTLKRSYYLPSDYKIIFTRFDYLSSLVVYFESYLKLLIINRTTLVNPNYFVESKRELQGIILKFFEGENWIRNLKNAWKDKNSFVTSKDINLIVKEIINGSFDTNGKDDEIIKTFLLIGVIRNYTAHDYFNASNSLQDEQIFKNKIIGALWYCWLKANNKI